MNRNSEIQTKDEKKGNKGKKQLDANKAFNNKQLTIKDDKELCDDLIVYTQEEKR
jgi:hypothetical protein